MKYVTRGVRKAIRKELTEEQDVLLGIHDFIVYEPEDTTTGLYDATGVEIHRMRESIGFVNFEED